VLKPDGTVERRVIQIGIKSEISAQVTSGLKEKELVVIRQVSQQKASSTKSALSGRKGP
jgi:hypothetical protein